MRALQPVLRRHVLHVTAEEGQAHPLCHWAAAAEDLQHVARSGVDVQLLALSPPPRVVLQVQTAPECLKRPPAHSAE